MAELGALTGLPVLNLEEEENQGVDPIIYNAYQTKSQTPNMSDQDIQRLYGTSAMPVFEWAKKIQSGQRTYNPSDAFDESMMEMYESFNQLPAGYMTPQEIMAQQALQGTVAGVTVTGSGGAPGAGLNIRIRGVGTNGENGPLVIIDGYQGNIDLLNPNDVESISVLKDAQAAIYGTIGSNGVVIIKTKSGKRNSKTQVVYNSYTGFQKTTKKLNLLNATEYALLLNESYANGGQALPFPDVSNLGKGTDWQKEVFNEAPIYSQDFAVSGGSDKIVYTGKIDEYFKYQFGKLQYRSLEFEHQILDMSNYQGNAVVNYTAAEVPFTRILEHKHFEFGKQDKTVVTKEYPKEWKEGSEPYYPVNDDYNSALYLKYKKLAETKDKIIFGGRLAEYKYYDMHQVIASALSKAKKYINENI